MDERTIHIEMSNKTTTVTNNTMKQKCSTRVAVLGTGNYGRALAGQMNESGVKSCIVASRQPKAKTCQELPLVTYKEAIEGSDIIFLCIPAHAYDNVIMPLKTILIGKTVVEISNLENENDPSNALSLQELIPSTHVIKALNTVSAYSLENGAFGASRDTYVCGDDETRKSQLMQVLREIGLNPIDRGSLRSAVMVEKLPFRFFSGWGTTVIITMLTLVPILFYTYLKYFWYDDQSKRTDEDLYLYVANRVIAWLMFWLLGLTYLPGVLAGFIQIVAGTKYLRFPNWLDRWMKSRKQLGLMCLLLASIHGCMSCLLLGAGEVKYMLTNHYLNIPGKTKPFIIYQLLNTDGQVSLLFAVLSLALMGILGITSLPSVSARMSWKEWNFIQRGFGFLSLIFGFIHVMVYAHHLWDPDYEFGWKSWKKNPKGIYPPSAFVIPMFPLLVIVLKLVLMLPGLSCYLDNIRNGRIGYRQLDEKIVV